VVVAAPVDGVVVTVDSVVDVVDVSVEVPLSELQAVSPPASTAPATAAARGKRRTI